MDAARERRAVRIQPFWNALTEGCEPKTNKEALLELVQDLKDEGNDLYKDGDFEHAWLHYRNALHVANVLRSRYYHDLAPSFISSLFSNKANCSLRKGKYNDALLDCDTAIQTNPGNIKAYYHKAVGLKALKRYHDALKTAENAPVNEPNRSVFAALIEDLKKHISALPAAKVTVSVSLTNKQHVTVQKPPEERANEWLVGTNAVASEKQRKSVEDKMPKKKKGVKVKKFSVAAPANFSDAEPESSESSLDEDEKFAASFRNVQQNNKPIPMQPTRVQSKSKSPDEKMGLDNFGGNKSKVNAEKTVKSAIALNNKVSNEPVVKAIKVSHDQVIPPGYLDFPIKDTYDFQLVCDGCFVQTGHGIKGYRLMQDNHAYACSRNFIIVRRKHREDLNWMKIRHRPEVKVNFKEYKLCMQFKNGVQCSHGSEKKCNFAHNNAEADIWTYDREGTFSIVNFIRKLRELKIYSSENLNDGIRGASDYIPGLNFSSQDTRPVQSPLLSQKPIIERSQPVSNKLQSRPLLQTPNPGLFAHPNVQPIYPMGQPVVNLRYDMRPPQPNGPYGGMPSFSAPTQVINNQPLMPAPLPPFDPKPTFFNVPPPTPRQDNAPPRQSAVMRLVSTEIVGSQTLKNPLYNYTSKVGCTVCYPTTTVYGIYLYVNIPQHTCGQNRLMMQANGTTEWVWVRERKNHRDFPGKYILCNSARMGKKQLCKYGEERCSFAHNTAEQTLWCLEKDGKFDIVEFILRNRSQAGEQGFTIKELIQKHGGTFCFICQVCYHGHPPRISHQSPGTGRCAGSGNGHAWSTSKVLTHVGANSITVINARTFVHKGAYFRICMYMQYCRKNQTDHHCPFAHSTVERDVWLLERDIAISREDIVRQAEQLGATSGTGAVGLQYPTTNTPDDPAIVAMKKVLDCPYVAIEVCGTCWKNGMKSPKDGAKDRCKSTNQSHEHWQQNKICLLSPSNKQIRSLPRKIPSALNFAICQYVKQRRPCNFSGGACQFAHCAEEIEVWKWMVRNQVSTVDAFVEASSLCQQAKANKGSEKSKIAGGQSVVSVSQQPFSATSAIKGRMQTDMQLSPHYCHYCGVQCNSTKQWDEHCASEKHNFNMNSDKEHQWNFRQPPWGMTGSSYKLCAKHARGHRCQYSNKPDMYNLCQDAHNQEELDEWRERYDWRQMKREMARQNKVFSYMDEILDKYENVDSKSSVMSESVSGIQVASSDELNVCKEQKDATCTFTFFVETQSEKPLERVALLHNKDRLHFSLLGSGIIATSRCQIAPAEVFEDVDNRGNPCHKVTILFTGGMFGSFSQWVVFDQSQEPVLFRKLSVEIGTRDDHRKIQNLREKLKFDRWTKENREVIKDSSLYHDPLDSRLTKLYKPVDSSESVITQQSILVELNQHNYVHKMHKLLEIEELSRHQIIASFNICAEVHLASVINEKSCTIYAQSGELYGLIPLAESLTDDTSAGKLILTSVKTVFLALNNSSSKTVYEASIVREENFNYYGMGRDYVYICLKGDCCSKLGLVKGRTVEMQIQFQMDRAPFCRMHYAVDKLRNTEIVFPNVAKINPQWNEQHKLKVSSSTLNAGQMSAIRHIMADRSGYTPPFILYGPFGTGKTETLAQAAMLLMKEKPSARILICAQSNSAADLYITKHLDPFLKKTNLKAVVRRVMFAERRVNTVLPEVKRYCLLSADESSFVNPTLQDIKCHRVVIVTLSSSLILMELGLQDFFTHIFVDEAAQALETETILPLSMAADNTCVVLAGDHAQISPKVYSQEAVAQKFHQSLLERLYLFYEAYYSSLETGNPLNILLSVNYRTKMEILRFISATFYGGPDILTCESNIPSVLEITPLTFYSVMGKEFQEEDAVSYYNTAEIHEVTERVAELCNNWPSEWGERRLQEVGVVAPYHDQVIKIRNALKGKGLRSVTVEKINNVQGKEFRALFLSTVRTQHLLTDAQLTSKLRGNLNADVPDFGFLSDNKLLNTALTRAKSFVAVIGDPIALCAIGECTKVWQTYLKHCQNMNSIHPKTTSLQSIKQQVIYLLNSPAGKGLQQIADSSRQTTVELEVQADSRPYVKEQNDANKQTQITDLANRQTAITDLANRQTATDLALKLTAAINMEAEKDAHLFGLGMTDHQTNGLGLPTANYRENQENRQTTFSGGANGIDSPKSKGVASPKAKGVASPKPSGNRTFKGINLPPPLQMPNLLKAPTVEKSTVSQVAGARMYDYPDDFGTSIDRSLSDDVDNSDAANGLISKRPLKIGDVHVKVKGAYAITGTGEAVSVGPSDSDSDDDANDIGYHDYGERQLKTLLANQPLLYRRCVLHIRSSEQIYADVLDTNTDIKRISIQSLGNCGHGFDNDEVVVEVESQQSERDVNEKVCGHVIGVLKHSVNPQHHVSMCTANPQSTGLMRPINTSLPSIWNLTIKSHLQHTMQGHVCVYKLTNNKEIQALHFERVNAKDPSSKLFVVLFLKWEPHMRYPVGIVIGVLPSGNSVDRCMHILEIEHQIPKKFSDKTQAEVQQMFYPGYTLPVEEYMHRLDYRQHLTFTIDPVNSEDLDVALSIEMNDNDQYLVGVHVADIAYYIPRGSTLEKEAEERAASFYPLNQDAVHMLPDRLATDLCSLKPDVDRLTISFFFSVATSGEITNVEPTMSVINSKYRFSYEDAEEIIQDPDSQSDYLKSCIMVLHQFAQLWGRTRLGNGQLYQRMDLEARLAPEAHTMLNELKIMTNSKVTELLLAHYPQCTPLTSQAAPSGSDLVAWKKEHATDALNSVALTKPFLYDRRICTCKIACACVYNFVKQHGFQSPSHLDVPLPVWQAIVDAFSTRNFQKVKDLIVNVENHPRLAIAWLKLMSIMESDQLICSEQVSKDSSDHYSLNVSSYASFTSPISRYADVVAQRMMIAMINKEPAPYSQAEVESVCKHSTISMQKAATYEASVQAIYVADALRAKPIVLYPAVKELSENSIQLCFPSLVDISSEFQTLQYCDLGISDLAQSHEMDSVATLSWQQRIYDTIIGPQDTKTNVASSLNPDPFVCRVPAFQWQGLLGALRQDDFTKLEKAVAVISNVIDTSKEDDSATEISIERRNNGKLQHFSEFSFSLHPGTVMHIQMSSLVKQGQIMPVLQLVDITADHSICVEHRHSPVTCFFKEDATNASQTSYRDTRSYVATWLPVMEIESVCVAVKENRSIIIKHVQMHWINSGSEVLGIFRLNSDFVTERQLKDFDGSGGIAVDDTFPQELLSQSRIQGYVCVRYSNLKIPEDPALDMKTALIVNNGNPITWVGHCHLLSTRMVSVGGDILCYLRLHQNNAALPELLLASMETQPTCTLELIPKSDTVRHAEDAFLQLSSCNGLAKDIAIGKTPVNINVCDPSIDKMLQRNVEGFPIPNAIQRETLKQAVTRPFTVIQGPPGSGKSQIAVRLACLFTHFNRIRHTDKENSRPQVLICGPSNATLNGIAEFFQGLGQSSPKVVCVFSEDLVKQEFPVPLEPIPSKKQAPTVAIHGALQAISLHHIIRSPENESSQLITEYDMMFKMYPDDIDQSHVQDYITHVRSTETAELKKADIILCTCIVSRNIKQKLGSNIDIKQIIIDDCNACTEPEAMVPIATYNARHVTVIGDPNQLPPNVSSKCAQNLGLGASLISRYSDKALMLTTQYRLHDGIAEFPACYFYDGQLRSGSDVQRQPSSLKIWSGSPAKPIGFYHIDSVAENVSIQTAIGYEQSRIVTAEADLAVSLASLLVSLHIPAAQIVVLSQYRAQCDLIQKELAAAGRQGITVQTVMESQGTEWQYVIFSTASSTVDSSQRDLNMMADEREINVAITRACQGLIIIGNRHVLSRWCVWRKLLKHYEKNQKIVTPNTDDYSKIIK